MHKPIIHKYYIWQGWTVMVLVYTESTGCIRIEEPSIGMEAK